MQCQLTFLVLQYYVDECLMTRCLQKLREMFHHDYFISFCSQTIVTNTQGKSCHLIPCYYAGKSDCFSFIDN